MGKRDRPNISMGISLECNCGARATVIQDGDSKWHAHCLGCGTIRFWSNPQLTERVKVGARLCPHKAELKPCKHGMTSWCPACRVRTFAPVQAIQEE